MAKAPDIYDPVNTVAPSGAGTSYLSVRADANDFGGQIGQAMQGAGNEAQEAAQKQMAQNTHFQEMYADSAARDGVVAASQKLGDLENEYKQNRGINAPAAYKTFQEKANALYEESATGMPNNYAQKLFRDQFSKELGYSMKTAGAWAADQTEQGMVTSLNSSMANRVNQFATAANDPGRRQFLVSGIRDDAIQYAHFKGLDSDTSDKLVSHNVGEGYATLIKGAAQNDPALAMSLYKEATEGSFTVTRKDEEGKDVQVSVPYLDAAHRAQIEGEMGAEFRRQFGDQFQAAQSYAKSGVDFDRNAFVITAKNAGKPDDYITAELGRLDQTRQKFADSSGEYNLSKQISADTGNAFAGTPVAGNYDPNYLSAVLPNNPAKVDQLAKQGDVLNQVAGEAAQFTTKTPAQIYSDIDAKYKPAAVDTAQDGSTSLDLAASTASGHQPLSVRNNNPGNMRGEDGNFIKFATPEEGSAAMAHDLGIKIEGNSKAMKSKFGENYSPTLQNVISTWAPKEDHNDPVNYANIVSQKTGIKPDQVLTKDDIAKIMPAMAGVEAGGTPSPADHQKQLYASMKSAADQYVQQLYKDPAGTLVSKDPLMTDLLNDAMQDNTGAKMGEFINKSMAQQDAAGVPNNLRTALPTSTATALTNKVIQNPLTAPDTFNKLAQQSGDHWNDVYHSMVTRGGLPSKYQAIAQLSEDDSTLKDAQLLSRWNTDGDTKNKTADDLLGTKNVKKIKDTVISSTEVKQLTQSLIASGASKQMVIGTMNSIESLAYAHSYYDQDSNAVGNAIKAFTSKYDYMDRGTARVPTKVFDTVNQNADAMLDNLHNVALPPKIYGIGLPGSAMTPDGYFAWVKASGTWVTSPNEDALLLKDPQDKLVYNVNGKPISIPFTSTLSPTAVEKKNQRSADDKISTNLSAMPFGGAGIF